MTKRIETSVIETLYVSDNLMVSEYKCGHCATQLWRAIGRNDSTMQPYILIT